MARRTGSADSRKRSTDTSTPRGILALLSAARVPAFTRARPMFHRKKPAPLATMPRKASTSHWVGVGVKAVQSVMGAETRAVAVKPPRASQAKRGASDLILARAGRVRL